MLNIFFVVVIVLSSIWVYLDAANHGIVKQETQSGIYKISALHWGIFSILLWIVGFPWYLYSRKKLFDIAKENASIIEDSEKKKNVIIIGSIGVFF